MTREIVIIGGGIIGCTTAYYLTRHPAYTRGAVKVTVIEASAHGPAQGASGKAGGLVARWAYPKELVDVSFDEHVKLAEEHNGAERWGWRYVECGQWKGRGNLAPTDQGVGVDGSRAGKARVKGKSLEKTKGLKGRRGETGLPDDLLWVEEEMTDLYAPMARGDETAQVHPYLFTTSMMELAQSRGAIYVHGKAVSIIEEDKKVVGVDYIDGGTNETIRIGATDVVLAAGAWSRSLLPWLPISGTRAHSVTIRPDRSSTPLAPYVLFTEIALKDGRNRKTVEPEIYARPDDEVYACGPGDNSPLPGSVDEVVVDQEACENIYRDVSSISKTLREGKVVGRQACFLPIVCVGDGGPIVGGVKGAEGLVVGTGHTCWVS